MHFSTFSETIPKPCISMSFSYTFYELKFSVIYFKNENMNGFLSTSFLLHIVVIMSMATALEL